MEDKTSKEELKNIISPCALCKGCASKQNTNACSGCSSGCGRCCQQIGYDLYDSVVVAEYDPNDNKESN